MERIHPESRRFDVVSLFSGIGGFDLGFDYAGFNIIWANDFDKYACDTYKSNINNKIVNGDIRDYIDKIPNHDVVIAGFPCQPFSTLGNLKGFEDNERGTLIFVIKEILERYKAKVFVLENVKNFLNHDNGNTMKKVINELESIGYTCHYKVLNSMDYGLPQRRNRVFIVGLRKEAFLSTDFEFPEGETLKVTTQDLLDKEVDISYFLSKKISKTILGSGTKGYIVKPTIDMPISKTLTATMHKMHRASQDNYVTDQQNFLKYNDHSKLNIRKLTPNECRKLQGFPTDWKQVVSDTQAYKQFGNAISVNVSYKIALKVYDFIVNNLRY
jgi:DNA (cytosine-5)-methyltransferase 1